MSEYARRVPRARGPSTPACAHCRPGLALARSAGDAAGLVRRAPSRPRSGPTRAPLHRAPTRGGAAGSCVVAVLPLLLGTSETVARLCAGLLPMTPYAVLRLAFECRVISGVLHLLAIGAHVCGDVCALNHLTLALVLASRAIHGLTLLLMPLGVIYIGTRLPASERATALGERNMWAAAGTAGGLLAGSVGTAVLPNPIAAGAAPGVLLVLTSIGMWLWIGAKFVDRQPLPQDEGEGTDRSSTTDLLSSRSLMSQVPVTHVALTGASNILGWAGYLAIEGTLTMVLVDGFAWPTTSIIIGWVPISLAIFVGTIAFRQLRKELKWELSRLAALSSHAAFLGGALMVATLVVPSPAVASACFVASCSILICAFALGNTLANAQLLVWLPPHLQTRIQPPVQLLASIGRALGPALGVVAAMAGGGFERRGGLMLPMTWLLVSLCVWLPGVVFAKKFLATPPALNPPPTPSSSAAAPPKASNGTATAPQGNSAPSNGAPPANSGAAQAAAAPPTAAAPAGGAPPSA